MGLFDQYKIGLMDVIRCDEPSYLIWKWRPQGSSLGETNRENTIRWGSTLRVKDGEVAVFVHQQPDGVVQDYIEGPFDKKIETSNLPIIASIVGAAYVGSSPFQAEVYFINLAEQLQFKFGVPYFNIFDPEFPEFAVPVAVRGAMNFKIHDYREFIKLHRLINFDMIAFQNSVRDVIAHHIKNVVLNYQQSKDIPVIQIESQISQINDSVRENLVKELEKNFGIDVSRIDISAVEIKKDSDGYQMLMSVTRDLTMKTMKAKTAANIEDYTEKLRIQREEEQYAQRKQTETSNYAAFQVESQTKVGMAAAEALGKMGENGGGSVDLGGGGAGFNPAAMMAGVAVGGAVGQNLAGMMNGGMAANVHPYSTTPPSIPQVDYHVVINGQAVGPMDKMTLQHMAQLAQITRKSYIWKPGMSDWACAESIPELAEIFMNQMPPIPTEKEGK